MVRRFYLLIYAAFFFSLCASSQGNIGGKIGKTSKTATVKSTTGKKTTPKKTAVKSPEPDAKEVTDPDERFKNAAYMDVTSISFCNTDPLKAIIDDFGEPLYAADLRYLTPKFAYEGLALKEKEITVLVKVFNSDGTLRTGASSPTGYTYSQAITVEPGAGNSICLSGWGASAAGSYNPGVYKFEMWYEGNLIWEKNCRILSESAPIQKCRFFDIKNVTFSSQDKTGAILTDYGETLREGSVQYLTPKISYTGNVTSSTKLDVYVRLISSEGKLINGSTSPVGFSYKTTITINPGEGSTTIGGYGNSAATSYPKGTTRVEYWIDGEKIYQTSVEIVEKL